MKWTAEEPNGKGNGWRIGPLWMGLNPSSNESRKIAHMVSAAPEMLAVLERLEESVDYWGEYDVPIGIIDEIKAAIRKARGE